MGYARLMFSWMARHMAVISLFDWAACQWLDWWMILVVWLKPSNSGPVLYSSYPQGRVVVEANSGISQEGFFQSQCLQLFIAWQGCQENQIWLYFGSRLICLSGWARCDMNRETAPQVHNWACNLECHERASNSITNFSVRCSDMQFLDISLQPSNTIETLASIVPSITTIKTTKNRSASISSGTFPQQVDSKLSTWHRPLS